MTSVSETTGAFEAMLKTATTPRAVDSDRGVEFTAGCFRNVCERHDIVHSLKDPQDANGLARMDNGIQQLKKGIRRLQEMKSGDWLTHLEHATSALNKTPHGSIDAAPNNLPDNVKLEQSNTAAQNADHNMRYSRTRREESEEGQMRALVQKRST